MAYRTAIAGIALCWLASFEVTYTSWMKGIPSGAFLLYGPIGIALVLRADYTLKNALPIKLALLGLVPPLVLWYVRLVRG